MKERYKIITRRNQSMMWCYQIIDGLIARPISWYFNGEKWIERNYNEINK